MLGVTGHRGRACWTRRPCSAAGDGREGCGSQPRRLAGLVLQRAAQLLPRRPPGHPSSSPMQPVSRSTLDLFQARGRRGLRSAVARVLLDGAERGHFRGQPPWPSPCSSFTCSSSRAAVAVSSAAVAAPSLRPALNAFSRSAFSFRARRCIPAPFPARSPPCGGGPTKWTRCTAGAIRPGCRPAFLGQAVLDRRAAHGFPVRPGQRSSPSLAPRNPQASAAPYLEATAWRSWATVPCSRACLSVVVRRRPVAVLWRLNPAPERAAVAHRSVSLGPAEQLVAVGTQRTARARTAATSGSASIHALTSGIVDDGVPPAPRLQRTC